MEEQYIKLLNKSLDSCDKATMWIFITLIGLLVTSFQKGDTIEVIKLKISKSHSGSLLYVVLIGLNFQVIKILQNISHITSQIKLTEENRLIYEIHPWVFNPFSKTSGTLSYFTDHIGFSILIILWWLGFAIAQKLLLSGTYKIKNFGRILFIIYLFLGVLSLLLIQDIFFLLGVDYIKIVYELVGIGLGTLIFYIISNRIKLIQNIFNDEQT